MSPDHNFLAYTIDVSGGEDFILQVKDLRTGLVIPNLQVQGVVSVAWAEDGRTLFYTQSDNNQRPFRQFYLLPCFTLQPLKYVSLRAFLSFQGSILEARLRKYGGCHRIHGK